MPVLERKRDNEAGRSKTGEEAEKGFIRTCPGRAVNNATWVWDIGKPQERIKWFYLRTGIGLQSMGRDKEPE